MTRDLAAALHAHLSEIGENTLFHASRAVKARTAECGEILRNDPRFSGPHRGADGRLYYRVASEPAKASAGLGTRSRPVSLRDGTDCARLFDALADGEWHSSSSLLQLGMTVHSRVSDLRVKHGCTIETRHDPAEKRARAYLYRLLSSPLTPGQGVTAAGSLSDSPPLSSRAPSPAVSGDAHVMTRGGASSPANRTASDGLACLQSGPGRAPATGRDQLSLLQEAVA